MIRQDEHVGTKKALNFEVTPAMSPVANLVVYYYQPDGELILNQIKLEFEGKFGNFVRTSLKP
jgi:hypothetical protein